MSIEKLTPAPDLKAERLAALIALMPEIVTDGKIDWEALHIALGDALESNDKDEHYGLSWTGKRAAKRLAAQPSRLSLEPVAGEGVNEDRTRNLYIEGDNLEVLKLLRKAYAKQVKLIYIDPPYNTGNDFVYKDNYAESEADYLARTGQTDERGKRLVANPKSGGRYHSNWLSMIYPRLQLARELLRDDGVIFVSIDDNEVHNLRHVMDEIFGAENFVEHFTIRSNPRGNQAKKLTASEHDFILCYSKTNLNKPLGFFKTIDQFNKIDDDGMHYVEIELRKRGAGSRREDAKNEYYPIYYNPITQKLSTHKFANSIEIYPVLSNGMDGRWRWSAETTEKNINLLIARKVNGRGHNKSKYNVYEKDYFTPDKISKVTSIFSENEVNTENGTEEVSKILGAHIFSYPKPVALLEKLLQSICDSKSIILDFFSGSATTAHAVLAQNVADGGKRRFIMVQLPEPTQQADFATIAEIGKERIRRVIKKLEQERAETAATAQQDSLLDHAPAPASDAPDLGFRVFRVAPSNFKAWQDVSERDPAHLQSRLDDSLLPLHSGWQAAHVRTEIMLAEGFALDSQIVRDAFFEPNTVWRIESDTCQHRLFVCLDAALDAQTVARFSLREGDVFVCFDGALDDAAKLNLSNGNWKIKTI